MTRIERRYVTAALVYLGLYLVYFFIQTARIANGIDVAPWAIFPWHILAMVLNFGVLILSIRDLYLRPFSAPNDKLTWLLLILLTGGIGLLVYLFKHGFRPRTGVLE